MNNQSAAKPNPVVVNMAVENLNAKGTGKCPYVAEKTEPSMFTRVEGQLSPLWVKWFMSKFDLSEKMATNIGVSLYDHLVREPRREIHPDAPDPKAMLEDVAQVSMAFVLHYKHKRNVSFVEAYTVGHDLVALQANDPTFDYHTKGQEPAQVWIDKQA